jgi:hypothetical protein
MGSMISVHRILYLYIIVSVVFTEVYVIVTWMQTITIMNYVLLVTFFLYKHPKQNKQIIKLQIIIFIFIAYIFLLNLLQNDLQKTLSTFITTLPIPFILGMFSLYPRRNELIFFFAKFYILYNLVFSILQVIGIYITSSSILAKIPIFGTYREFVGVSATQGVRISGAGASTISLACILGIIFILFYFYKYNDKLLSTKERSIYLLIVFVLILLTQTRSLIFALPIVIIITSIIVSKNNMKGIFLTSIGTIVFIGLFYTSLPTLMEMFPRLFLTINDDGSVIHRIQANVYGAIGTFNLSPWVGVPFSDAMIAMRNGLSEIGLFIGNYFINEVTYHNQLFYYFRHYGLIGLGLFILLFWKMIKVALDSNKSEENKKILFAIILFYFLYTLSHNNKWTMDYYLWVFMALQFKYETIKDKFINENR